MFWDNSQLSESLEIFSLFDIESDFEIGFTLIFFFIALPEILCHRISAHVTKIQKIKYFP